jgi:hypothetical protein
MANVIIYDEATGAVKSYLKSVHTPTYSSRSDVLVNPTLPETDLKYMKVSGGVVVEMTQEEKDAVDAALAPTYTDLREKAYIPIDGDLHDAIASALSTLDSNGVDIGQEMKDMLATRQAIKDAYPKPA